MCHICSDKTCKQERKRKLHGGMYGNNQLDSKIQNSFAEIFIYRRALSPFHLVTNYCIKSQKITFTAADKAGDWTALVVLTGGSTRQRWKEAVLQKRRESTCNTSILPEV